MRGSDDEDDGARGVRGNERLRVMAMATATTMEQEGESERQTETEIERRVRVRERLTVRGNESERLCILKLSVLS